jgi:acyl-CoA reductase-like NAD-dependent aldehyde dehydrogenase
LEKLKRMVKKNQSRISEAVAQDLRKPPFEAFFSESAYLLSEIDFALKHLDCWTQPGNVSTPPIFLGAESRIYPEPYGVALIIAPWNYPFNLLLAPLVGAMAAGNCAVLKPSELSSRSSAVIASMFAGEFDPAYIAVVEGGMEVNVPLMEERFDCIFYTGGTAVGRVVMGAAARHLTPVTLELGGKTPCIIDRKARVGHAARRIAFGKFLNAGQTCIAPDYLLVQREVKQPLIEGIRHAVRSFYGEDPHASRHFARIINEHHFERLERLMEAGEIIMGGERDRDDLYIAPTLIDEPPLDAPIMQEEIFGPILPVIAYDRLEEAIDLVNSRPKPLALYLFSPDRALQERVLRETSSGGVCINSTLLHESTPTLPFGGVGDSGMGAYHGKASFDTFTHYKSVLRQRLPLDDLLRPPYPDLPVLNRVIQRLLVQGRKCRPR